MTDKFSYADLRKCAEREVAQRRRVYARLVEKGRMTPPQAGRETAMMERIAELLADLAKSEELPFL
jgi:hypothetical protein